MNDINWKVIELLEKKRKLEKERDEEKKWFYSSLTTIFTFGLLGIGMIFTADSWWGKLLGAILFALTVSMTVSSYRDYKKKKKHREVKKGISKAEKGDFFIRLNKVWLKVFSRTTICFWTR